MPEPEPNKRMDELLRACAKRPRPAVALHPVSRRALQDEVKTVFARPKKSGIFSAWWIRGPMAAAFVGCAVLLILQNRRFEEGQNYSRRPVEMAAAKDLKQSAAPSYASAAAAASVFGGVAMDKVELDSGSQMFWNSAPAQAPQPILNSFQVRRQGDQVVVRDEDGSVYKGKAEGGAATAYNFAVQGVNNRSQQAVQFRGQMTQMTQMTAGNSRASNGQSQALVAAAARVSGTVTVGATNQFQIEANASPAPSGK